MKSKIVLFFTIILSFLLQSTLLQKIAIGSITPNLLLILCVSMGLMRGRKSGLWTGFFSGLLVDLFYGSVFGFYALIYMYAGFFSGYAFRIYYDDDIKVPMALTAIMDLFYKISDFFYCCYYCLILFQIITERRNIRLHVENQCVDCFFFLIYYTSQDIRLLASIFRCILPAKFICI